MSRLNVPPFAAPFLTLALLIAILAACRTGSVPADPAVAPTPLRVVTVVGLVGPPAPTRAAAAIVSTAPTPQWTVAPTVPVGPVAWTLTILHTGEVYGDVLPCG